MEKDEEQGYYISPNDLVTVTKMNHIVEVQHMTHMNRTNNIRKLDQDRYLNLETGEIKEFNRSENRSQNVNSLRQTFKKMRYLINTNFAGRANELHITLTYAENMTDTKRLYKDFKNFVAKLRRRFKGISSVDNLNVIEPQERGAWHCHALFRFNDVNTVFIPSEELAEMWGQGFVTIRSLKNIDNIGAYLTAYLADVELTGENFSRAFMDESEITTKVVEGVEKKFIKGGRLHMYPPSMNLFRKSGGIIYPTREKTKFKNIKKIVGSAKPHYVNVLHVENDGFQNDITKIEYNTKRKD